MHSIFCVLLMLTVAPIVTCSTLVILDPSRWGGNASPLTVLVMAFFGLISRPIWPTYVPALIVTPLLMGIVAKSRFIVAMPLSALLGLSFAVGAIAGFLVMGRMVLLTLHDHDPKMAMNWAIAGGVGGAVTLILVVLVYRNWRKSAQRTG